MTCQQVERELSAYLDGELTAAARAGVDAHVAGCSSCRERLAELDKLVRGVGAVARVGAPPGFLAAVRGKLARPGVGWDWLWRPWWVKLPLEAVAAVVVVGLAAWWWQGRQERPAEVVVASAKPAELPASSSAPAMAVGRMRLDELRKEQAVGNALSAAADRDAEAEVVVARDAAAVPGLVERFGGKVISRVGDNFRVEVPAVNVVALRAALEEGAKAKQDGATGRVSGAGPVTVLEIRVAPATP